MSPTILSRSFPPKILSVLVVVAVVATVIPVLFVLQRAGGIENWQGIPPPGMTDSFYYYARMREVVDGHPRIGNPFAFEHRDAFSPAFVIPDIASALPLLVGLPLSAAITVNFFMWSLVFLLLAHTLFTLLRLENRWAVVSSIFLYVSSYSFMLRPTVMQTIFPLFLGFLISLILFLYEPRSKKRALWFAFMSALTFYCYNYLAFVVFIISVLLALWFLVARRYPELRSLLMSGLYTIGFLVPFGVYSLWQMGGPFYAETLVRIGLVFTRIPSAEAFFFGRWVVIALFAFAVLWFFLSKKEHGSVERRVFWVATGFSLFVGLFLNVITGVELTLAVHIGRFVILWMVLAFCVLMYEWHSAHFVERIHTRVWVHAVMLLLILLLSLGVVRNIPRALAFFKFDMREIAYRELQAYAGPLRWLDENVTGEVVIWSNLSLGNLIPIMTEHYPLFHNGATLQAISDSELKERYLLWRSMEGVTIEDAKRDLGLYAGGGLLKDQPRAANRHAWLCTKVSDFVTVGPCPLGTDAMTLLGESYFEDLVGKFGEVKERQRELLSQYHVEYLLVDTTRDTFKYSAATSSSAYADGRFLIFPIEVVQLTEIR